MLCLNFYALQIEANGIVDINKFLGPFWESPLIWFYIFTNDVTYMSFIL